MNDRRRADRVSISWPMQLAGMSGLGTGHTINLSLSGVLFKSDVTLACGDLIVMRMTPDASTIVDCVAQVVRVDIRHGITTYGADFRHISASDRQRLSFAMLLLRDPGVGARV